MWQHLTARFTMVQSDKKIHSTVLIDVMMTIHVSYVYDRTTVSFNVYFGTMLAFL